MRERRHLEDIGLGGWIILKRMGWDWIDLAKGRDQ
jgi:hypothetical protein